VPQESFNFRAPYFPLRNIFGTDALDRLFQTQDQIAWLDGNGNQAESFASLPLDGIPQRCGTRQALRYDQANPRSALGSIRRTKVKIKTRPAHNPSSHHYRRKLFRPMQALI
jgi:hypothetical protein